MTNLSSNDDATLDRASALEVRLATSAREIEEAQRLRYEIFYREMGARPSAEVAASGRDFDQYDPFCDHLLVVDHDDGGKIVATYRLMTSDGAARSKGFYTAGEYDISAMLQAHAGQKLLELGRSCVLKPYRTGPTMQLLWRGLLVYVLRYDVAMMFGCASLPGTDPKALALQLSYLYHFHMTAEPERVRALPQRYVPMNLMAKEDIDTAEALRSLPPLVKGYIRMESSVGDGAVIDHQFGTTDVFVYLPVAGANPRWLRHLKKKVAGAA